MDTVNKHYSVSDIEARILDALSEAGFDTKQQLSPMELAALDHFHTGGLASSQILQELAQIRTDDRVLDIGAG
ncbi:MAG: SAM-dependent methyltransferase, partial [Gammaproteobacteria bacterium]|nr:SAM-dependent methyltransferase [Gammaproteobacteria bacterium]